MLSASKASGGSSKPRPVCWVDRRELLRQKKTAEHWLVETCLNHLVDQVSIQQTVSRVRRAQQEPVPVTWMDQQFRGNQNSDFREMLLQYATHGIIVVEYSPASKGIPPMTLTVPTNSQDILFMATQNRALYTRGGPEQGRSYMGDAPNLKTATERVAYMATCIDPTSVNIRFTVNELGEPENFIVTPLVGTSGSGGGPLSEDEGMKNVRVFYGKNTFKASSGGIRDSSSSPFSDGLDGGNLIGNGDGFDSMGLLGDMGGSTLFGGNRKTRSTVSMVSDLVDKITHLESNGVLTMHRRLFPPFAYVRVGDSKFDAHPGDLKEGGYTGLDLAKSQAFNDKYSRTLISNAHRDRAQEFSEHFQLLQLTKGLHRNGLNHNRQLLEDVYLNTLRKEPWAAQVPLVMTPGFDLKFWPAVNLTNEELTFLERFMRAVCAPFGMSLNYLMNEVKGNSTTGQAESQAKILIRPKISEMNTMIHVVLLHILHDTLMASVELDAKANVTEVVNGREQRRDRQLDRRARRMKAAQNREAKKNGGSGNGGNGSNSSGDKESSSSSSDKITTLPGTTSIKIPTAAEAKRAFAATLLSVKAPASPKPGKNTAGGGGDDDDEDDDRVSDSSSDSEPEDSRGKAPQTLMNEFMSTISFDIQIISPIADMEEMTGLVNMGVVELDMFKLWIATKYSLPYIPPTEQEKKEFAERIKTMQEGGPQEEEKKAPAEKKKKPTEKKEKKPEEKKKKPAATASEAAPAKKKPASSAPSSSPTSKAGGDSGGAAKGSTPASKKRPASPASGDDSDTGTKGKPAAKKTKEGGDKPKKAKKAPASVSEDEAPAPKKRARKGSDSEEERSVSPPPRKKKKKAPAKAPGDTNSEESDSEESEPEEKRKKKPAPQKKKKAKRDEEDSDDTGSDDSDTEASDTEEEKKRPATKKKTTTKKQPEEKTKEKKDKGKEKKGGDR